MKERSSMSKKKRIIVTVFGGWFGLHKYLDGKIGMGILYTLTAGLFYIGWIYDCVKSFSTPQNAPSKLNQSDLIRWQNMVMTTDTSRLVATRKQLETASQMCVDNNLRILNDSLKLVYETTSPKVFFQRLDTVIECYNELADLNEFYNVGFSPVEKLQNLDEHSLIHAFIRRYWYKILSESEKLKTEKGRENKKLKAKQDLLEFSNKIDSINVEYINELS